MIAIGVDGKEDGLCIHLAIIDDNGKQIGIQHYDIRHAATLMKQLNQAIIEAEILYAPEQPE